MIMLFCNYFITHYTRTHFKRNKRYRLVYDKSSTTLEVDLYSTGKNLFLSLKYNQLHTINLYTRL